MKKIIIGEQIVKAFGEGPERNTVLNGVSLEIESGEFVSVMGPSGSGKSTLMYALSGMDELDGGRVVFSGKPLSGCGENELADLRRTKMGFVFQQATLLSNLDILDNIVLPSMRDNRKKAREIEEKAKRLMVKTGIGGLERRGISQVSGGQLQRAGICRALMSDPEIIFGDEPTGALNSGSAQEIMDLFAEINSEGTAVMLVTHDAGVAARSERILFMKDGAIVNELRLQKYDGGNLEKRIERVTAEMRELGI